MTTSTFSGALQAFLISALSAIADVALFSIRIVVTKSGSLIVTLELPTDGAARVISAFTENRFEFNRILAPLDVGDTRYTAIANQEASIQAGQQVKIRGRDDLGDGEVLRIKESGGTYHADIVFEKDDIRRLETFPVERLVPKLNIWERLVSGDFDAPVDFLLVQLAHQMPLANTGGELSNARTALLPHQILLTHHLVAASRRRLLIADEVGLGKTIETGMFVRELIARGEAERVLVVCPAGLIKNWQNEMRDAFRLDFDVLGIDFVDASPLSWETHARVIASIDTLKKLSRLERLLAAPRWDIIIFDEAHHLSRTHSGRKTATTQNYKLADSVRGHTRDLIFLSATPHQGDAFQFWSLIQLLDDSLFDSPEAMLDHRGLLNRVMIRRTKREVTDPAGQPIFMRRQVLTQSFILGSRERDFYDMLTEYLREGYTVAGLDAGKTTSQQRAVGFVMTTFQKIMSSSPRAIRQALRRRLLALLAREQMRLEGRAGARVASPEVAARLQRLQVEMRELAVGIVELPASASQSAEADTYIAQLKQRLARRIEEETTSWALDGSEDVDDIVYAESDIPDEAHKVRALLALVPDGPDRKFETLVRAIEHLRREDPAERYVVFTQYVETLKFLVEELGQRYGSAKVCALRGGPLDDKIAAVERFWLEIDGAQFLISTSAGGEGINLQVGHILFNYDLPWNPMAVEQRIGRVHRYGQKDTVQVYNLVAEDTVEEQIYRLLEDKLLEIARAIGKTDTITGQVVEDFRSEILGFLGSSPNYQDLYRRALVDRDYLRTEREIAEAIEKARQASEALRVLAQDLDTFNLEHYRTLRGQFNLDDLRLFVEKTLLRLGGAVLPDGDTLRIDVPEMLQGYRNVSRSYRGVTFDRNLAMRRRNAQLLGLGHPLVDALIAHYQSGQIRGEATHLRGGMANTLSVRCIFTTDVGDGHPRKEYRNFLVM
ncbi:MAG TPA: SNF2-related protein, partial [Pyrinomonadaceae bacterium]|nr:SNF2-related protein [Pyrinomonadaceae bacterium]